jgi:hypothetical protein
MSDVKISIRSGAGSAFRVKNVEILSSPIPRRFVLTIAFTLPPLEDPLERLDGICTENLNCSAQPLSGTDEPRGILGEDLVF